MCLFIETIRVEEGRMPFLDAHLDRVRRTRQQFWGSSTEVTAADLASVVEPHGLCKLRFVYDATQLYDLSCTPYVRRAVGSLQLVEGGAVSYAYKQADRTALDQLRARRDNYDEVLIVKDGFVTDTSYTNVAFYDGRRWVTPHTPLLAGTRRARLLRQGRLTEAPVTPADIPVYTHVALFNAMVDLGELVLPTACVVPLRARR